MMSSAPSGIAQAEKLWAVAAPDLRPAQLQTANFILLGNVSQDRLAEVGKVAETERSKIAKLLKLDEDGPLVKGGLTLFVLQHTSEYGEFVRYVEERECAVGVLGHAHTKGTDLYAVLLAGVSDEKLPALVAEQISAGMSTGLERCAGVVRGRRGTHDRRGGVEPKSPLVKKWEAEVQKLPATENADTLLSAAAKDPETVARSYAFVRSLTRKLPQFQRCHGARSRAGIRRSVERGVSARCASSSSCGSAASPRRNNGPEHRAIVVQMPIGRCAVRA